ncbi:hypothetical protein [Nocardioides plantarum]|uniref:Uncharacterized protein n=1 Tax=Nocardioides plantarum TaxID=29299 RepID=A0ABV5K9L1_9ACTN|nr:hypothetical protein [Nocardioides plantarum]
MKRIVVGLLAAFLAIAGLVAFTPRPATASCPYTNCVTTQTTSTGVRSDSNTVVYAVTVRSAGNTSPKGTVKFVITKYATSKVVKSQTKTVTRLYSNSARATFSTGNLAKGKYTIRFTYNRAYGTVFRDSSQARSLVIK